MTEKDSRRFKFPKYLLGCMKRRVFDRLPVCLYAERAQGDQEIAVTAPAPVCRLSRRMFQDRIGQIVIKIDEQCPVDKNRLPPPRLCIAGDFTVSYSYV